MIKQFQILLLAAYFGAAALVWPSLPERIPIHLDISGEPTNWVQTGILSWFGLPILAVALTLLLHWFTRFTARTPELWNIPEKKRFLALPPTARAPIENELRKPLMWTAPMVTISLIAVHIEIYRIAVGRSSGQTWLSLLLTFLPIVVVILLTVRSVRQAGRQILEASAASGGEAGT